MSLCNLLQANNYDLHSNSMSSNVLASDEVMVTDTAQFSGKAKFIAMNSNFGFQFIKNSGKDLELQSSNIGLGNPY